MNIAPRLLRKALTPSIGVAILLGFIAFPLCGGAADTPHKFPTAELQQRYQVLLEELRCLVCQNQSLADSHAELAQDLRDEVHRMLTEELTDEEIRAFMVERYGDFVLYKPPIKTSTLLLWFGPFVLITIALLILWRQVIRQKRQDTTLSDEERAYAASLSADSAPPRHSNPE